MADAAAGLGMLGQAVDPLLHVARRGHPRMTTGWGILDAGLEMLHGIEFLESAI